MRGAGLLTAALLAAGPAVEPPAPPRVDIGRAEHVRVELVLLEVTAVDRRGLTVPGLRAADFELIVDGKPVPLVAVDEHCAGGAIPDPRAGEFPGDRAAGVGPIRRFVHVFDYLHLESPSETLEQVRDVLGRSGGADEEHMIVALGPGLRVEAPFTADRGELQRVLARMEHDPSLYAGNHARLTLRPFYSLVLALVGALELVPDAKAVVLYSGPMRGDGFTYDPYYREIAAVAARSRVTLYPVDAGGLRAPLGFRRGDLGGPKKLARLAAETGGRVTYHTNDLGLGYARAARDLGCRYTIAFHNPAQGKPAPRRVTVRVLRGGVRAVHAAAYLLRSSEDRRGALMEAALLAPELFPPSPLSIEVEPLARPDEGKRGIRVAVRIDLGALGPVPLAAWSLDGVVTRPSGARVGHFERHTLDAAARDSGLLALETISVRPGPHRVTVALGHPDLATPLVSWVDFDGASGASAASAP